MSTRRSHGHLPLSSTLIHLQLVTSLNRNLRALTPGKSQLLLALSHQHRDRRAFAFLDLTSETGRQQDLEFRSPRLQQLESWFAVTMLIPPWKQYGACFQEGNSLVCKAQVFVSGFLCESKTTGTTCCPYAHSIKPMLEKVIV